MKKEGKWKRVSVRERSREGERARKSDEKQWKTPDLLLSVLPIPPPLLLLVPRVDHL
jgi:hypothetical protein